MSFKHLEIELRTPVGGYLRSGNNIPMCNIPRLPECIFKVTPSRLIVTVSSSAELLINGSWLYADFVRNSIQAWTMHPLAARSWESKNLSPQNAVLLQSHFCPFVIGNSMQLPLYASIHTQGTSLECTCRRNVKNLATIKIIISSWLEKLHAEFSPTGFSFPLETFCRLSL